MCGSSRVASVSTSAAAVNPTVSPDAVFGKAADAAFTRTLNATAKAKANKKGNLTVVVFDTLNDIILARGGSAEASEVDKEDLVRAVDEAIRRVNNA